MLSSDIRDVYIVKYLENIKTIRDQLVVVLLQTVPHVPCAIIDAIEFSLGRPVDYEHIKASPHMMIGPSAGNQVPRMVHRRMPGIACSDQEVGVSTSIQCTLKTQLDHMVECEFERHVGDWCDKLFRDNGAPMAIVTNHARGQSILEKNILGRKCRASTAVWTVEQILSVSSASAEVPHAIIFC